ncbi:MAG: heme-binding domain-containing protein [Chitinophagales bacterium]|nr:heme-binding domain-containing protein [Chitinophagales bacterium]
MLKKVIGGLGLIFILIQFIRPDQTNPATDVQLDFSAVNNPPEEIKGLLKAACYDCHSNETIYPWYSQIAPVSWWLSAHVREGREHLNFSTFGQLPANDRAKAFEEVAEVTQEGEMPMASYTWTHPEARLSPEQKNSLVAWFSQSGGAKTKNSEEQEDD